MYIWVRPPECLFSPPYTWLMAPLMNSGLMLKLSNLFQTRNHLFQKRLFGEDVRDSLRLHDITSWAGISTARNNFAADGKISSQIFAPYSIYKGNTLLSAAPVLPTFSKLETGDLKLDRHGAIMLAFCPAIGTPSLFRGQQTRQCVVSFQLPFQLTGINGANTIACFARSFASKASESTRRKSSETRKDVSTVEDPFDAPTYNIPEKPVTFTEGASYSVIILAGLGIAAAAGYAVFKELIFQPKEYKIFGKALERIQNDNQVRVRIGSPVTGYGQESRNRAARQRIPNRTWTDEDGVEHVEVNFYIRGPHGAGKVYTEMFKDKVDKQWKFTYLIVEIKSPSPAQLMLESYVPA